MHLCIHYLNFEFLLKCFEPLFSWSALLMKCMIMHYVKYACTSFISGLNSRGRQTPTTQLFLFPKIFTQISCISQKNTLRTLSYLSIPKIIYSSEKKVKRVLTCRDCIGIEMTMTNQTTFWVKITKGYECYYCKNITHIGWHSNKKQEDFKIFGILFFSVDDWLIATFVGYYSNSCNKQNKTIVTTINCTFYSTLSTAWKGLQLEFWFTYSM